MENYGNMEIRLVNPPAEVMKAVQQDANENNRSVAGQTLFILKKYYNLKIEPKQRKPRSKKEHPDWPDLRGR